MTRATDIIKRLSCMALVAMGVALLISGNPAGLVALLGAFCVVD